MSTSDGWQPISRPTARQGADAFRLSPFSRLARAHVFTAAGDALLTIALAGSLFFDLDPNDARWKVFLYLGLTMAPLALVAPFIGPALDRSLGGRRWMIIGANGLRAVICLIMVNDLDSLLLFPEAFAVLALGKAYGVARSAVVPTVVRTDAELVEANSKLQLLSGLAAPAAAVPAGIAYAIAGSEAVLVVAVLAYSIATVASLRIPSTQVAESEASEAEEAELRGIGILLAASAMGLVRGIVGFVTFLLLFQLREEPTWQLGVVLGLTGVGALVGSTIAPLLRRSLPEERMIIFALGLAATSGLLAAWVGGLVSAALMAAMVAIVSTSAKLAFDSLVQRDAPDANRGRSFARFELRFQIVWVLGAMLPVLVPFPLTIGYLVIAGVAGFALFSYVAGQRAAHRAHVDRPPAGPGIPPDTQEAAEAAIGFVAPAPQPAAPSPAPPVDPTAVHPDRTAVERQPSADDTYVQRHLPLE
ncbi:MAG: MFS transporter [Acidimicrobiales bacterium]